jgi:hypothetical protein
MPNPTIRIHNIETNEIIDREMTDAELESHLAQEAIDLEKAELRLAKEAAKIELLAKLGITEDEAKLLLG